MLHRIPFPQIGSILSHISGRKTAKCAYIHTHIYIYGPHIYIYTCCNRCVPTCVAKKLVLSVPFFHGWQGRWGSRSKNFARRAHEANASPGTQREAPGRSWRFGHQQHTKPKNRDNQHMLNQHRGSFPDVKFPVRITENNSPKRKKRYVIILSPMEKKRFVGLLLSPVLCCASQKAGKPSKNIKVESDGDLVLLLDSFNQVAQQGFELGKGLVNLDHVRQEACTTACKQNKDKQTACSSTACRQTAEQATQTSEKMQLDQARLHKDQLRNDPQQSLCSQQKLEQENKQNNIGSNSLRTTIRA